ncbi:MAG: phage tail tube protein [Deltaproteobacteria bacterium]|nr:phage tail tube protein [Deltaproteobacteria bacterium]
MGYGQLGHLALSFQSSFGTTSTTSFHYIPLVSETLGEKIERITESSLYARLAEPPIREGVHEVAGELRTEAHPVYLGVFLKAALGQGTVTPQGSAFLHQFIPAKADWDAFAAVPPLTAELHRDVGSAFVYGDLLAEGLTLEIAHGQLLTANLEILGGRFSQKAAGTPSFLPGRPWTWDVVSASYDGAGQSDLRQISVRFGNQLTPQHSLSGLKTPRRIKRSGAQQVTVEGSLLFESQTLFQAFAKQDERRLLVTLRGEPVSSGYDALLTLEVPRLRFQEFSPQIGGAGPVEVGFTAAGVFDATSNYALRVTLVNTQAAY